MEDREISEDKPFLRQYYTLGMLQPPLSFIKKHLVQMNCVAGVILMIACTLQKYL